MEKKDLGVTLANILSKLFPAQNVTAIAVFVYSFFSPIGTGPYLTPLHCAIIGIATMVLLPGIPLLYALWKGIISFNRTEKEKRRIFYAIGLIGYGLASIVFAYYASTIMLLLALSYFFVTLACALVNFKWKISVHTAGIGGPATSFTYIYGLVGSLSFILVAALIWARVKLEAHTLLQSVAGAVLSSLITLAVCLLLYPQWNPAFPIYSALHSLAGALTHA